MKNNNEQWLEYLFYDDRPDRERWYNAIERLEKDLAKLDRGFAMRRMEFFWNCVGWDINHEILAQFRGMFFEQAPEQALQ